MWIRVVGVSRRKSKERQYRVEEHARAEAPTCDRKHGRRADRLNSPILTHDHLLIKLQHGLLDHFVSVHSRLGRLELSPFHSGVSLLHQLPIPCAKVIALDLGDERRSFAGEGLDALAHKGSGGFVALASR